MMGVFDGFRWCILRGQSELYISSLCSSVAVIVLFLWFGVRQFRKTEKTLQDII